MSPLPLASYTANFSRIMDTSSIVYPALALTASLASATSLAQIRWNTARSIPLPVKSSRSSSDDSAFSSELELVEMAAKLEELLFTADVTEILSLEGRLSSRLTGGPSFCEGASAGVEAMMELNRRFLLLGKLAAMPARISSTSDSEALMPKLRKVRAHAGTSKVLEPFLRLWLKAIVHDVSSFSWNFRTSFLISTASSVLDSSMSTSLTSICCTSKLAGYPIQRSTLPTSLTSISPKPRRSYLLKAASSSIICFLSRPSLYR
mmetsp:Transcript_29876/g.71138  ORF Transcript_29876/g.71138 Transcript_29876/m.71138 type:complete len:263 (-) Transcript_29876:275-1063(-)